MGFLSNKLWHMMYCKNVQFHRFDAKMEGFRTLIFLTFAHSYPHALITFIIFLFLTIAVLNFIIHIFNYIYLLYRKQHLHSIFIKKTTLFTHNLCLRGFLTLYYFQMYFNIIFTIYYYAHKFYKDHLIIFVERGYIYVIKL